MTPITVNGEHVLNILSALPNYIEIASKDVQNAVELRVKQIANAN